jgi:hypothetical protein
VQSCASLRKRVGLGKREGAWETEVGLGKFEAGLGKRAGAGKESWGWERGTGDL